MILKILNGLEICSEKLYVPVSTSGSTKVKYHWIIYHIILPRVTADPLLPYVDAEYIENLIESCRNYCASAEYAVYKLTYCATSNKLCENL